MGPTGTGKTLAVSDKLLKGMSHKYLSHFISFSARTSANQTQDIIDSKLDKRSVALITYPTNCNLTNYGAFGNITEWVKTRNLTSLMILGPRFKSRVSIYIVLCSKKQSHHSC